MRRNKYRAQRTNGFASKLEARLYELLLERQRVNEIADIKCQQAVVLQPGPPKVRISWKVDFSFINLKTNQLTYCEAKGVETMDFKLKLKLWRKNPPAPLEIWKGSYQRPFLAEQITVEEKC